MEKGPEETLSKCYPIWILLDGALGSVTLHVRPDAPGSFHGTIGFSSIGLLYYLQYKITHSHIPQKYFF